MSAILFWWFITGIAGSAIIFTDDLHQRLRWDDADLNLGDLVIYGLMAIGGPITFVLSIRDTHILEIFMQMFGECLTRLSEIKLHTFKKRKTNESD